MKQVSKLAKIQLVVTEILAHPNLTKDIKYQLEMPHIFCSEGNISCVLRINYQWIKQNDFYSRVNSLIDLENGDGTSWHKNKELYVTCYYKNGKLIGMYRERDERGILLVDTFYAKGKAVPFTPSFCSIPTKR